MSGKSGRATAALVAAAEGAIIEHESFDLFGRQRVLTSLDPAPANATHVHASSGNVANASAVAALAAPGAGVLNYLTGFEVTAAGATAGLPVIVTITGLLGGTLSWIFTFPAGVLVGAEPLVVLFDEPIPAAAANSAITLTCPAGGAGNTHACATIHGFKI